LLDTRRFGTGAIHLRYRLRGVARHETTSLKS
jgi:hypothetical protein